MSKIESARKVAQYIYEHGYEEESFIDCLKYGDFEAANNHVFLDVAQILDIDILPYYRKYKND